MPAQIWEVVGGGSQGGILAREGMSLKSAECEGRLSTGALIEEVDLVGERLCYKRLTGTGPEDGWVSLSIKGKEIVTKTDKKTREAAGNGARAKVGESFDHDQGAVRPRARKATVRVEDDRHELGDDKPRQERKGVHLWYGVSME